MGYFKEAELPFQYALANAFTLCDGYHCSMHTGTNSNRMFLWSGTNGPTGAGVASLNNEWDSIESSALGYEWKTYPERLQEAKVSWIVYQNMPDNFGDNPLARPEAVFDNPHGAASRTRFNVPDGDLVVAAYHGDQISALHIRHGALRHH